MYGWIRQGSVAFLKPAENKTIIISFTSREYSDLLENPPSQISFCWHTVASYMDPKLPHADIEYTGQTK